jgi:hypothetical protein
MEGGKEYERNEEDDVEARDEDEISAEDAAVKEHAIKGRNGT